MGALYIDSRTGSAGASPSNFHGADDLTKSGGQNYGDVFLMCFFLCLASPSPVPCLAPKA